MRILSAIAQNGPIAARDLASITAMDKALISRVLSKLSADGFIAQKNEGDRIRLLRWYLTEDGKDLVAHLRPEWERREDIIQADLSSEERRILKKMLHRMFDASERLYADETKALKRKAAERPSARRKTSA
jgi:DNA-binding MarR family transcriptional regulator